MHVTSCFPLQPGGQQGQSLRKELAISPCNLIAGLKLQLADGFMASLSQSCEQDCFLVSSHLRISNASLCARFELKNSSCCLFANNVSLMLSVFPCSYLVSFLSYSMFPPCYPGSLPCYPIVLMFSFLNSLNVDRCVMFGGSQKFFFA